MWSCMWNRATSLPSSGTTLIENLVEMKPDSSVYQNIINAGSCRLNQMLLCFIPVPYLDIVLYLWWINYLITNETIASDEYQDLKQSKSMLLSLFSPCSPRTPWTRTRPRSTAWASTPTPSSSWPPGPPTRPWRSGTSGTSSSSSTHSSRTRTRSSRSVSVLHTDLFFWNLWMKSCTEYVGYCDSYEFP